jgi:hypothetical protein
VAPAAVASPVFAAPPAASFVLSSSSSAVMAASRVAALVAASRVSLSVACCATSLRMPIATVKGSSAPPEFADALAGGVPASWRKWKECARKGCISCGNNYNRF